MQNRSKKGFTIVELVIVIAVVAILAAVLIPTFSGVINKANQSKALQEIRQAYIKTVAEDAARPESERVFSAGEEIIVKHENGVYIKITADGEAFVLEADEEIIPTHILTADKVLIRNPDHPSNKVPGAPETGIALNKTALTLAHGKIVSLEATVSPEGAVEWTSSDPALVKVNNGMIAASSSAEGTATITATVNGKSASCVVTVEHLYETGICACGDFITYTLSCQALHTKICHYEIVAGKYVLKDDLGNTMTKCPDHPNAEGDYECHEREGNVACNGCLKIQHCKHEKDYEEKGSTTHTVTCSTCKETYTENHTMQNGTCSRCGHHEHNFVCYYIDGSGELVKGHKASARQGIKKCSYNYCDSQSEFVYTYYSINKTSHSAKCGGCYQTIENHVNHELDPVEGLCACGYFDCGHDLTYEIDDSEGHLATCETCEKTVKVAHTANNSKCSCGAFVLNGSYRQSTLDNLKKAINGKNDPCVVYLTDNSSVDRNLTLTNTNGVTMDLGGKTLSTPTSYSAKAGVEVVDCNVTIKNGTLKTTKTNGYYAATAGEKSSLTIENVEITNSDEKAIDAWSGSTLILKEVKVNGVLVTADNYTTYVNVAEGANVTIQNTEN